MVFICVANEWPTPDKAINVGGYSAGHLLGCLRARGCLNLGSLINVTTAIAQGKYALINGCLQSVPNKDLVSDIGFKSANVFHKAMATDACRPDNETGGNIPRLLPMQSIAAHLYNCCVCKDFNAKD